MYLRSPEWTQMWRFGEVPTSLFVRQDFALGQRFSVARCLSGVEILIDTINCALQLAVFAWSHDFVKPVQLVEILRSEFDSHDVYESP